MADQEEKEEKEWTLMFYFASDNPLTPSVITQLKALKQAGYDPEVNVVAHFDPQTEDTPSHIFDVNLIKKLNPRRESNGNFAGNDPFVRTLMEDKLWGDQTSRNGSDTIRLLLKKSHDRPGISYNPPRPPPDMVVNSNGGPGGAGREPADQHRGPRPKEPGPRESLSTFLKFCREHYRAKHYMLFILGHGVVVGDDIFLFDEHVDSDQQQSLSLESLGEVLRVFAQDIKKQGSEFELVSFHSCSVSSMEVAHELQYDDRGKFRGTANYMLASQGPAFVGSWPYREIVIRVLNDVNDLKGLNKQEKAKQIKRMLVRLHKYILRNSSDFLLAGYSFHVALCDLNKVSRVTAPVKELSDELIKGLRNPIVRNLILLAHCEAISFWEENYTDLYDFCFCLIKRCREYKKEGGQKELVRPLQTACGGVLDQLTGGRPRDDDKLIVRSDFAGPSYQFSHGLSVFFPWAEPPRNFMSRYNEYRFTATSWHDFLNEYFERTRRKTHREERAASPRALSDLYAMQQSPAEKLKEDMASICFNNEGPMNTSSTLDKPIKIDVGDPMGGGCTCGSIKNYPHDTRPQRQRVREAPRSGCLHSSFNLFG